MKIKVIVQANSKCPKTELNQEGNFHIYVREPATEGKANRAVVEKLSEIYKTPKSSITLIHGTKSKNKIFEIEQ